MVHNEVESMGKRGTGLQEREGVLGLTSILAIRKMKWNEMENSLHGDYNKHTIMALVKSSGTGSFYIPLNDFPY